MRTLILAAIGVVVLCGAAGATRTLWLPPPGVDAAEVSATIQRCQASGAKAAARRSETTNEMLGNGVTMNNRFAATVGEAERRSCLLESRWQEIKLTDAQYSDYQKLADEPARIAYLRQIAGPPVAN